MVTPGWRMACSTVRDSRGFGCGDAALGGDVAGGGQVAVTAVAACCAGEAPAGWSRPVSAAGAGGADGSLVNQFHGDAGLGGFVDQGGSQMGAPPGVGHPPVVVAAGRTVVDAFRVAHHEGAHPVLHGPGHHGFGRLVVGLADPSQVAGLGPALGAPQLFPAPRAR
jgi:hypothetical protein